MAPPVRAQSPTRCVRFCSPADAISSILLSQKCSWRRWCGAIVLFAQIACTQVTVAAKTLPEYGPADAALFDDTLAPEIFETDGIGPTEPIEKLQERVVLSEGVVPMRITTVTRDTRDGSYGYELVLVPIGPPLVGATLPGATTIVVIQESPSFPQVQSAEATLVGVSLIFFYRHYTAEDSKEIHWRAEPNTDEVRLAVSRATAIRAGRPVE